jgi:hypothetical protein
VEKWDRQTRRRKSAGGWLALDRPSWADEQSNEEFRRLIDWSALSGHHYLVPFDFTIKRIPRLYSNRLATVFDIRNLSETNRRNTVRFRFSCFLSFSLPLLWFSSTAWDSHFNLLDFVQTNSAKRLEVLQKNPTKIVGLFFAHVSMGFHESDRDWMKPFKNTAFD